MLIVCPSCATSYDVDLASLGPQGRSVRCVRCRTVWHAAPTRAEMLASAALAIGPPKDGMEEGTRPSGDPILQSTHGADEFEGLDTAGQDASADGDSVEHTERPPEEYDRAAATDADEGIAYSEEATADIDAPLTAPADDLDEASAQIEADDRAHRRTRARNDIETAARRQRRGARFTGLGWPLSGLWTAILALAIADVVIVGWRSELVRFLPQTASFYAWMKLPVNLRGLAFEDVTTSMEQHEGVPILVVDGNVLNEAGKKVDVPRLKFVVRNAARQEIYSWTAVPSRAVLSPGEAESFRSRLASPPADAHDVLVRFVSRRDIVTGTR